MVKTYKILMCGHSRSGKTSIIEKLISDKISETYNPTIEDTYNFSIETDRHTKEKIRIFDLGGGQINVTTSNCAIEKHYLTTVDAVIMVHDLGNTDSFKTIELLKKDIDKSKDKREITISVICNKRDLGDSKTHDNDPIYKWTIKEKVTAHDINFEDRKSIAGAFVRIVSKLSQPPSKGGFPFVKKDPKLS